MKYDLIVTVVCNFEIDVKNYVIQFILNVLLHVFVLYVIFFYDFFLKLE